MNEKADLLGKGLVALKTGDIELASELLRKLSSKERGCRNPYILAGAIVYCADKILAQENQSKTILTQSIAALAMKIPEYSIRDHYVKVLKPAFRNYILSS